MYRWIEGGTRWRETGQQQEVRSPIKESGCESSITLILVRDQIQHFFRLLTNVNIIYMSKIVR